MALNFTSTASAAVANGVKVLVYATAGTGKTMLSATAPAPVLISAESGLLSLSRKNIERVFGVDQPGICYDVPVIEIKTVDDLQEAYLYCHSQQANQFQTICLDSISEIAETVLANAKRGVKDKRQAYGELLEQMADVIRKFRDLNGKNVYMSAKMESYKDELTGVIKYGPSMPGSKLSPQMPYWFDEVLRLGIGQDNDGRLYRYFQTQPDLQYEAKDRSGALDLMEYPNLAHIFAKITGV